VRTANLFTNSTSAQSYTAVNSGMEGAQQTEGETLFQQARQSHQPEVLVKRQFEQRNQSQKSKLANEFIASAGREGINQLASTPDGQHALAVVYDHAGRDGRGMMRQTHEAQGNTAVDYTRRADSPDSSTVKCFEGEGATLTVDNNSDKMRDSAVAQNSSLLSQGTYGSEVQHFAATPPSEIELLPLKPTTPGELGGLVAGERLGDSGNRADQNQLPLQYPGDENASTSIPNPAQNQAIHLQSTSLGGRLENLVDRTERRFDNWKADVRDSYQFAQDNASNGFEYAGLAVLQATSEFAFDTIDLGIDALGLAVSEQRREEFSDNVEYAFSSVQAMSDAGLDLRGSVKYKVGKYELKAFYGSDLGFGVQVSDPYTSSLVDGQRYEKTAHRLTFKDGLFDPAYTLVGQKDFNKPSGILGVKSGIRVSDTELRDISVRNSLDLELKLKYGFSIAVEGRGPSTNDLNN
jgi:hypothetical protein